MRWSEDDLARYHSRMRAPILSAAQVSKPSKYGNHRTERDGFKFDSKLEADRYGELCLQRAAGLIRYFLRQVRFDLPGPAIYRADFGVCESNGQMRYEDVKGFLTDMSKLKIKQVEALYGVTIELWPKR